MCGQQCSCKCSCPSKKKKSNTKCSTKSTTPRSKSEAHSGHMTSCPDGVKVKMTSGGVLPRLVDAQAQLKQTGWTQHDSKHFSKGNATATIKANKGKDVNGNPRTKSWSVQYRNCAGTAIPGRQTVKLGKPVTGF